MMGFFFFFGLRVSGVFQQIRFHKYVQSFCVSVYQRMEIVCLSVNPLFSQPPSSSSFSALKILKEFDLRAHEVRSSSQSERMDSAQNPFYALTSDPVWSQGGRVNREMKDVVDGQRVGLRGVMGCCGDIYCPLKKRCNSCKVVSELWQE